MGHGLPAKGSSTSGEEDAEQEIPPGVFNWMRKAMARIQIKRLRAELREAKKQSESAGKNGDGKDTKHPHQE